MVFSVISQAWVQEWAKRYDENSANQKEQQLEKDIFDFIKKIGQPPSYLTKDVLKLIAEWKAPRIKGYIKDNDDQFVRDVTQVSLTTKNERLRLEVLTLLNGVGARMASTILFFCYPTRYPVMDYRAINSLKKFGKINEQSNYTFDSWQKYSKVCREIAAQNSVDIRTLDKALWVYNGGYK